MRISELIAELEKAKTEHGDIDVVVFDEEMGEWVDIDSVDKDYMTVIRPKSVSMHHVVALSANYDV